MSHLQATEGGATEEEAWRDRGKEKKQRCSCHRKLVTSLACADSLRREK